MSWILSIVVILGLYSLIITILLVNQRFETKYYKNEMRRYRAMWDRHHFGEALSEESKS